MTSKSSKFSLPYRIDYSNGCLPFHHAPDHFDLTTSGCSKLFAAPSQMHSIKTTRVFAGKQQTALLQFLFTSTARDTVVARIRHVSSILFTPLLLFKR
jgi:hypothetical protein